jgi:transcriptional regulator with XRE-family HTH domain
MMKNADTVAYVVERLRAELAAEHGAARRVAKALGISPSYLSQVRKSGRPSPALVRSVAKYWGMGERELSAAAIEWAATAGMPRAADSETSHVGPLPAAAGTVLDASLAQAIEMMAHRWLPQTIERLSAIGAQWPTDRTCQQWLADGEVIDRALRRAGAEPQPVTRRRSS